MFSLIVVGAGGPPAIASTPPTDAAVGPTYLYAVTAADADGDSLTYALDAAPAGMAIDPVTGDISWTPAAGQTGPQAVIVRVADGAGGFAAQAFAVVVASGRPNRPPVIGTLPPADATVGTAFAYTLHAADPDGQAVRYAVVRGPAGLTVDADSGLVRWTPAAADEGRPLDYNPCLGCKLCVAACPVGAIGADGHFDPAACLTHNYREFMAGFTDWVGTVAGSGSENEYRRRVTDAETASVWQSLAFGPNYKAAYCLAVCPAGEEVIAPFLADRAGHVAGVVKPLQQKEEPVYVVPGSDAEEYAARKYPHKWLRRVGGVRPTSIKGFLSGMPIVFQRGRAAGLDAVYHFTFTGSQPAEATVTIRGGTLDVRDGLHGAADCAVTADADTWVGFMRKERSIVLAILRRRVRVKGPLRLLTAFGRCSPS